MARPLPKRTGTYWLFSGALGGRAAAVLIGVAADCDEGDGAIVGERRPSPARLDAVSHT